MRENKCLALEFGWHPTKKHMHDRGKPNCTTKAVVGQVDFNNAGKKPNKRRNRNRGKMPWRAGLALLLLHVGADSATI